MVRLDIKVETDESEFANVWMRETLSFRMERLGCPSFVKIWWGCRAAALFHLDRPFHMVVEVHCCGERADFKSRPVSTNKAL